MRDETSIVRVSEAKDCPSSLGSDDKEFTRAKNTAYRYLSIRPRSRAEIEHKLREKKFEDDVVRRVLAALETFGYVNDREFAGQWARSRVRLRGFGRRRIEQELRGKGIGRDIIDETFADLFEDASEADVARREAEKKLKTLTRFEPGARRRRLAGFLERKGFSTQIISSIIRTVQ